MKLAFGARWLACLCLPALAVACGSDGGATFPDGGAGAAGAGSGGTANGGAAGAANGGAAGSGASGGDAGSAAGGNAGDAGSANGGSAGNGGSSGSGASGGQGGSAGAGAGGSGAGGSGAGGSGAGGSGAGGSGAGGSGATGGSGGGAVEGLLISEYLEGSANNKALEIYNGSAGSVDLSGCSLQFYFAGSANSQEIALTGSLAPKAVLVVCDDEAAQSIADNCDIKSDGFFFNGDDAIELVCKNALVDSFGQRGVDPGDGWGDVDAVTFTKDHTLRRKCSVTRGDTLSTDAFDPALEWDGFPINASMGLGRHCSN